MLFQIVTYMLLISSVISFISLNPVNTRLINKFSVKMANSFYEIIEKDSKGDAISFDKFKGKVVYGVNVASKVIA